MENKIIIESLSMDLYRVAIGLHRNSHKMAQRFSDEARALCLEIKQSEIRPYFVKVLGKIQNILSGPFGNRTAEDILMYSIICKNYARKYLN